MSGPGALRAILQAARQHGIRRPREAFLATQSPAWQKAFGQSVVKEPQWHYGSFDVEKGNTRPNGPMHFGTYKASQDREHNVPFERLERHIREALEEGGMEPGPELNAEARKEMGVWIESDGIPDYLIDDPREVKRASYFLDIRNPMRVEDPVTDSDRWAELEELARKQGHDALVYRNAVEDSGSDSYVPLNDRPQVKAVTAREFNMRSRDVHKAGGGLVKGLKAARKGLSAADPEALTPAGRLRAEDAQWSWSRSPSIIKAPGGNWLDGSVERAVAPLKPVVRRFGRDDITPEYLPRHIAKLEELLKDYKGKGVDPETGVDLDVASEHIERQLNELLPQAALNRWIDKKLVGYIKNDMATERDPVRALAERNTLHFDPHPVIVPLRTRSKREGAGFPDEGVASSTLAKTWETLTDSSVFPLKVRDIFHEPKDYIAKSLSKDHWLTKVPLDAQVYQISTRSGDVNNLGFDHLVDVLREQLATGVLTPQQLDKVTMANAVERAHAYNLEREAARKAAQLASLESMTPYKQYDEGWRWVQLDKPGQFAAESDAMGHSVRGYEPPQGHADWDKASGKHGSLSYGHGGWDAIKAGRAKIYSLKGPDGKSYATVETKEGSWGDRPSDQHWLNNDPEALEAYKKVWEQTRANRFIEDGPRLIQEQFPEVYERHKSRFEPYNVVTQIKGPGNRAPDKAALPYLQDFVRSGKWSDVRDLGNAQLRKRDDMFNELELKAYRDATGEDMSMFPTVEQANRLLELTKVGRRYKYDDHLNLRGDWEFPTND